MVRSVAVASDRAGLGEMARGAPRRHRRPSMREGRRFESDQLHRELAVTWANALWIALVRLARRRHLGRSDLEARAAPGSPEIVGGQRNTPDCCRTSRLFGSVDGKSMARARSPRPVTEASTKILRPTATRKRRTAKRVATTKLTTSATARARRAKGRSSTSVPSIPRWPAERTSTASEPRLTYRRWVKRRPRWQRAVAHHVRDDVRDEHG